MSRIGKKPIPVPASAEIRIEGNTVTVKGPKGVIGISVSDRPCA